MGSPGIYGFCDRLKAPPVFYNTSKKRTSGELTDLLYNEISHMLIFCNFIDNFHNFIDNIIGLIDQIDIYIDELTHIRTDN